MHENSLEWGDFMRTIQNTTIIPYYSGDNKLRAYHITPNEGYLIHVLDPESEAEDRTIPTFTSKTITVGYNYDFNNVVADTFTYADENVPVNKVGNLGLYTIPADIVPKNEIYGGGDKNHEKGEA